MVFAQREFKRKEDRKIPRDTLKSSMLFVMGKGQLTIRLGRHRH